MKKTLTAFLAVILAGPIAMAGIGDKPADKPPKTKIFCYESEVLPGVNLSRVVEIKTQEGRAANYLEESIWDSEKGVSVSQEVSTLVTYEYGSIAKGEVIHFVARLNVEGYLNYIRIVYPWGTKRMNMLPAAYVGKKDGKQFSVPMYCTHMK